jgi:hypothetical protein
MNMHLKQNMLKKRRPFYQLVRLTDCVRRMKEKVIVVTIAGISLKSEFNASKCFTYLKRSLGKFIGVQIGW